MYLCVLLVLCVCIFTCSWLHWASGKHKYWKVNVSVSCFSSHIILPLMSWVNEILVPPGFSRRYIKRISLWSFLQRKQQQKLLLCHNKGLSVHSWLAQSFKWRFVLCFLSLLVEQNRGYKVNKAKFITVFLKTLFPLVFSEIRSLGTQKGDLLRATTTMFGEDMKEPKDKHLPRLLAGYSEHNAGGQSLEQRCVMLHIPTYLLVLSQQFSKQYWGSLSTLSAWCLTSGQCNVYWFGFREKTVTTFLKGS